MEHTQVEIKSFTVCYETVHMICLIFLFFEGLAEVWEENDAEKGHLIMARVGLIKYFV